MKFGAAESASVRVKTDKKEKVKEVKEEEEKEPAWGCASSGGGTATPPRDRVLGVTEKMYTWIRRFTPDHKKSGKLYRAIDAVSDKMLFYIDSEYGYTTNCRPSEEGRIQLYKKKGILTDITPTEDPTFFFQSRLVLKTPKKWDDNNEDQHRHRRFAPNNPEKQIQKLTYTLHWINDQCLIFCRDHDELGNKINKFSRQALQVLALYTKPNFRPTRSPKERPPDQFRPTPAGNPPKNDPSNIDGGVPDPFFDFTTAPPSSNETALEVPPSTTTTTTTTTITTTTTTSTTSTVPPEPSTEPPATNCGRGGCQRQASLATRSRASAAKNPLSRSSERLRKFFLSWG
ncbi:Oidioi.mRNA.OKI2018_I69.XSR.g13966.t1.cds [Oikopleura dioica]|uniref:Oidioi.mRNA.OKI2018_I69.XSR.g13966.t1.cds n=1 Tax=Oikopleura dioica TaxID=34765 RepID=A0ABN7SC84_OIKDI|nr:Oidioi.mRNA.OKI2018_I69.XSR.g13966.t1.cds [Oikopleura dioica]